MHVVAFWKVSVINERSKFVELLQILCDDYNLSLITFTYFVAKVKFLPDSDQLHLEFGLKISKLCLVLYEFKSVGCFKSNRKNSTKNWIWMNALLWINTKVVFGLFHTKPGLNPRGLKMIASNILFFFIWNSENSFFP